VVVVVEVMGSSGELRGVDGMTYLEDEGLMVVRVSVRHFSVVRVSVRGRIAQKNGLWLVEFHRKKSPPIWPLLLALFSIKEKKQKLIKDFGFVHHTFVTQL
jgi:hypothetical protein